MANSSNPVESGYKYVIAYGIVIAILVFITRTRIGYATVYYLLVLSLFFLLVTQSKWIADMLASISGPLKDSDEAMPGDSRRR